MLAKYFDGMLQPRYISVCDGRFEVLLYCVYDICLKNA
jgi:hypothetical protein